MISAGYTAPVTQQGIFYLQLNVESHNKRYVEIFSIDKHADGQTTFAITLSLKRCAKVS
jgi:hypothetical protein